MLKRIFQNWRYKLLKKYRVEVIDDVTLSHAKVFTYRPLKFVIIGLISSILLIGGTTSLIFFVPFIRKQIPGYLNPAVKEQQAQLMNKVQILGQQIEMRDSLIKTLQNSLLNGQKLPDMEIDDLEEIDFTPASASSEASQEDEPAANSPSDNASSKISGDFVSEQKSVSFTSHYISPINNLFSPVNNGKVSNPFNTDKQHYGLDLVAEENELVRAAADGFVIMAEYHEESGYVIGISSRDEVITFYKHNSTLHKKVGDYVYAGESIAVMGNSGENSTGPHLHFELWYRGTPLDPSMYINFN